MFLTSVWSGDDSDIYRTQVNGVAIFSVSVGCTAAFCSKWNPLNGHSTEI